jgi:hypothetical protein
MPKFYVETYWPPYPNAVREVRVHTEHHYTVEALSPNLTGVWCVEATRKGEAIPILIHELVNNIAHRII